MPRLYCDIPLSVGNGITLPDGAARHVQVLRMQPGQNVELFNGLGGHWHATITRMGRSDVEVAIVNHIAQTAPRQAAVHLALGVPANERMDWLVEKATELGVASIQALTTQRSVLRLSGERAAKRQQHWQAVAVAACEQSGHDLVPQLHPLQSLDQWLSQQHVQAASPESERVLLSLGGTPFAAWLNSQRPQQLTVLSGPEGGLTEAEESQAQACGFAALRLGTPVLRAETAPLAVLAAIHLGRSGLAA